MSKRLIRRILVILVLGAAAAVVAPASALAGGWVQISCVNPNGTASTSQGWAGSGTGLSAPATANPACQPGHPMEAVIPSSTVANPGGSEALTYTPPSGSTLAGGTMDVRLTADSYGNNPQPNDSSGAALVMTPGVDPSTDEIETCAHWSNGCWAGENSAGGGGSADDFPEQTIALPSGKGGTLNVLAACLSEGTATACANAASTDGYWAGAFVYSADLELSSTATPTGTSFGGSLLQPNASGTAQLTFTAGETAGPGIYSVAVEIDGTQVYSGTPDTNGGACSSQGTYPGTSAMEFDTIQPCPLSENVTVPVDTSTLATGAHSLIVSVTDAAGNTQTVLNQSITTAPAPLPAVTTSTPTTTPTSPSTSTTTTSPAALKGSVRVRFVLHAHFHGRDSKLLKAEILKLPADAVVSVRDGGPHHPPLTVTRTPANHARRLLRALTKLTFHPGDTLVFTVTAPGKHPERLQLAFRNAKEPVATLLDTYTQRLTTPQPAKAGSKATRPLRTRLRITARYNSTSTQLRAISALGLPARARVSVSDRGPHSPLITPHHASGTGVPALLRGLTQVTFVPGDRLIFTLRVAKRRPERVELVFRNGEAPSARLL